MSFWSAYPTVDFYQSTSNIYLYLIFCFLFSTTSASVKPENYEVAKEGQRTLLPCDELEVLSEDTVIWKKSGKNVIETGQSTQQTSILSNGTLVFNSVDRKDWGLYVCSVTTKRYGHEVTITKSMFLNVQCKN